ncbi:DNA polymerase III subunit epsilon [Methylophilaceae bacterium]|jgi:DNA polymerase-3 subunit epsilon|nr:DNA polymerase III subunit epsilon [Methylophilaceae bacterium]
MKKIFLDTETTGLDPNQGHRIIEIAAVEMINRQLSNNQFHVYINPEREIDEAAQEVHGLTLDFLSDKALFQDIAQDFIDFIADSELIIHNAPFDLGFLNMELGRIKKGEVEDYVEKVTDSLAMARELRPGQRNNLDALCRHYGVDNSQRNLHGALLDSLLLSEVYIGMTRGQEALEINFTNHNAQQINIDQDILNQLKVIQASERDLDLHLKYLEKIKTN